MQGNKELLTFDELCKELSISSATGKIWIKLNKIYLVKNTGNNFFFEKDYVTRLKSEITNGSKRYLKSRRNLN